MVPSRALKAAPPRRAGLRPGSWNAGAKAPAESEVRRPYLSEPVGPPPSPGDEARKAAADLGSFFRSLTPWDRWAAGASAALLAALALPWRWTREDEEIIGLVAAWPVALLAVAVLVLVYLRSRANAAMDRRLRLAQLSASAMALITNLLFLSWASQGHSVRGAGRTISIALSRPELGAYVGLACAAAALFASMPLLKAEA